MNSPSKQGDGITDITIKENPKSYVSCTLISLSTVLEAVKDGYKKACLVGKVFDNPLRPSVFFPFLQAMAKWKLNQ